MKIIVLLLAITAPLLAQKGTYTYEKETSLSSAAEKVTIHLPSGTRRTVKFVGATVYCSAACTVTLSRDGSAPTNTAATAVKLNSTIDAATAVPYHTSNVGASTTIKTYTIAAGVEQGIDMPDKGLLAGENLSLGTNTITGTARIYFQWREF